MKNKRLLQEYTNKLEEISSDRDFVFGQVATAYGEDEIRYMMAYINDNPQCKASDVILEDLEYTRRQKEKQCVSAIMGLVVGDALGVPVEFMSRTELKEQPVEGMRGFGTHNQPAGTWSDDSSMVIATMEWLTEIEILPPNYNTLMDNFSDWLLLGKYTPYGETFDCGISTSRAIINYAKGIEPTLCGGRTEFDNGNGSLMRILPAALWYSEGLAFTHIDRDEYIHDLSALTHAHPRSKIGCLLYAKIIADMMHMPDRDKFEIVEQSLSYSRKHLESALQRDFIKETEKYYRLWNLQAFKELPETEIKSSGYIVDTLEAALWCFLNTESYRDCVLKAVNLGEDTDTLGAVSGGIAGLYYGYENIPEEWISKIPSKEVIIGLAEEIAQLG